MGLKADPDDAMSMHRVGGLNNDTVVVRLAMVTLFFDSETDARTWANRIANLELKAPR